MFFLSVKYAPDKLNEFIDSININLQPLFMQIRKGMSEESGLWHYALVSYFSSHTTPVSESITGRRKHCKVTRHLYVAALQRKLLP